MITHKRNRAIGLGVIAIAFMLTSCEQADQITTSNGPEATRTTLVSTTLTPVLEETPNPETTDLPSQISSSTLQIHPSAMAQLADEEAYAKLQQLLKDNGGCKLPCLWQITPGRTTVQDALAILEQFTAVSEQIYLSSKDSGSISPILYAGDLEIYTRLAYVTKPNDPVIERLLFNSTVTKLTSEGNINVFNSNLYSEYTSFFRLDHLLSELGIPSSVLIHTYGNLQPNGRGTELGFYLIVIYPEHGVLAEYTTDWSKEAEDIIGCFSSAHLKLHLSSPGTAASFEESLAQTEWAELWPVLPENPYWKPLDESTSLTIEEFQKIFSQPTDQCLITPANLWPVPES